MITRIRDCVTSDRGSLFLAGLDEAEAYYGGPMWQGFPVQFLEAILANGQQANGALVPTERKGILPKA